MSGFFLDTKYKLQK